MDPALDLRLREIRARLIQSDPVLYHLVGTTASLAMGSPVGVVFALGAHLVQGVPVPSEEFGTLVDEATADFFRTFAEHEVSQGRDASQYFEFADETLARGVFAQAARDRADTRRRFWEQLSEEGIEYPNETTDLPQNLWEDAFTATIKPHAVTLKYASMREPAGDWEPIGTIRVVLRHVTAWWPKRIEFAGEPEA